MTGTDRLSLVCKLTTFRTVREIRTTDESNPTDIKLCVGCGSEIRLKQVGCETCLGKLPKSLLKMLKEYQEHGLAFSAHAGWQMVHEAATYAMARLRDNPAPPERPWASLKRGRTRGH
jgi:hypothetical protein